MMRVTFSKVAGFSLQPATLLKVTLLYGCFSRFFKLYKWYQIMQSVSGCYKCSIAVFENQFGLVLHQSPAFQGQWKPRFSSSREHCF